MSDSKSRAPVHISLVTCLLAFAITACGGKEQIPASAPTPVAPSASTAPAPVPAAPVASAPVASSSAAATPAPEHHHEHLSHHPMAKMLFAEVSQLGLRPDQKASVEAIEAELENQPDLAKEPREKLAGDVADGVAAGKLDKAKIDADLKKLAQAGAATSPALQEATNKLHKTLDAAQRKKLVELMQSKAEEHRAHGMGAVGEQGPGEHAEHAKGEHGEHAEHAKGEHGEHAEHAKGEHGEHAEHAKGEHGEHAEHAKGEHVPGEHGVHGMGAHARLEQLTAQLALTPEQTEKLKRKLESNMKAEKAAMKDHAAVMQKSMKVIGDAFQTDQFDAKKLGVGDHAGDMMKMMADRNIRFVEAVLSVLTPDQRAKFAEHVRQHHAAGGDE